MTAAAASKPVQRPGALARRTPIPSVVPSNLAYYGFIAYLILEFARPPLLVVLRLQMVVAIVLPFIWMRARERPWSNVLTAQLGILLASAMMVPIAHNNYSAYFTTRNLFANISVAVVSSWLFSTRAGLMRFYWWWLLVLTYVAIYGILHGGHGPGGFLGDENDLALGCVSAFPFAFYGFERLPGWKRWLAGGCGAVLATGIVVSVSRGGFVGLVAALIYCYATSAHKVRNLFVALAASAVFAVAAPKSFWDEMATIQDTDQGTADSRQFLWATAFNMWEANPIVGVGGGNFPYNAGHFQPKGPRWASSRYSERDWSGTVTHSTYFQLLSETGLVGVSLFAWMLVGHFLGLHRLRRDIRRRRDAPPDLRREAELHIGSLAGGMIAVLAGGAFLSAAYYPYFYFYAGVSVGVIYAFSRSRVTESART